MTMMVKYTRQEKQAFYLRCEACHLRPLSPVVGCAIHMYGKIVRNRLNLKFLMFRPVTAHRGMVKYAALNESGKMRG
jgi:hypothetical protein